MKSVAWAVTAWPVGAESVGSTRSRKELDTRGRAGRRPPTSPNEWLRDALQADDGQVVAPFAPLHQQLDLDSGSAPDEGLGRLAHGKRRGQRSRGSNRGFRLAGIVPK